MPSRRCCAIVLGLSLSITACASDPEVQKSPSEIIPITESNLRGQQSLYREGWFVVSSTEKAFSFAKEHSITSSGKAMSSAFSEAGEHTTRYRENLSGAGKSGVKTGTDIYKGGTQLSKQALGFTAGMVEGEWDYGSENLSLAWERFVKGNMTLAQRTEEDRKALKSVPGNWYKDLKSDFRNLDELTDEATNAISSDIEGRWDEAFSEARSDFNESYQQSGTRGNSLSGLGDIMVGYVKVLYSGLVKPASRTAVQVTTKGVTDIVFLPASKLLIVSGRTIQSTGLSLYYTTSMGVKLISPTVEGGLLSGLAMLSYGAIPVTAAVGGSIGAVNQVAVTTAAPVAGAGRAVAAGAAETGVYAAQVSYDMVKGAAKVTMHQAQSGIVLGYNALTALPTQALLGAANGIVFLAYDGPRLVIASVKGEVQWSNTKGETHSIPVQSLPVGSVVDLAALGMEPGVQIQVISDDPDVVKKVLENLPDDLRVGDQP